MEISILWSFAEVYSPPLWDWGTDEATLWKCYPPVIWENQGKKHQRQKCEFSDIQLCNSFLFLNIQIFEKNWYYCVCVCLIKVGQSTQYDIMCVVLSLFFKYAIIQFRDWAETETSSQNQNWFLLDYDTRNTGIPATIFMQKAERIYSSCTFIQKVKGESQSERKNLNAFFLKVVAGMPAFTAS